MEAKRGRGREAQEVTPHTKLVQSSVALVTSWVQTAPQDIIRNMHKGGGAGAGIEFTRAWVSAAGLM